MTKSLLEQAREQGPIKYDDYCYCNKCGKPQETTVVDSIDGTECEVRTQCPHCGHHDYWAYGFFESQQIGLNASKKYSFRG
jgi:hypothetical protein